MNDTFHSHVVRSKLTRNIAVTFKEVHEELVMAMGDFIPTHGDGAWQIPGRRGHGSHETQNGSKSLF